jgi:iron complex transport system substrate-binding protein
MKGPSRAFSGRKGPRRPAAACAFAAACLWTLPAGPAPAQERAIRVTDDTGYALSLAAPPRRIVSLSPNITEILFDLGLGERVAAVTRYCDYPEEALKKPKIGGILDPDIERIKALAPDLVIGFRGNLLSHLRKLRDLGLPVFILDQGNELAGVPPLVRKIGAATGRNAEADGRIKDLAARAEAVAKALAPVRSKPRIFLSLQGSGLWSFGRPSYFTDLLRLAKGESVTGGLPQLWLEYGREALIRDDPQALVILARSDMEFREAVRWYKDQPGFDRLQAVRRDRFLYLDQDAASRFGPRLFQALEELARRLHPDRFPPAGNRPLS